MGHSSNQLVYCLGMFFDIFFLVEETVILLTEEVKLHSTHLNVHYNVLYDPGERQQAKMLWSNNKVVLCVPYVLEVLLDFQPLQTFPILHAPFLKHT